jgi:hypothetical protein
MTTMEGTSALLSGDGLPSLIALQGRFPFSTR